MSSDVTSIEVDNLLKVDYENIMNMSSKTQMKYFKDLQHIRCKYKYKLAFVFYSDLLDK